METLPLVKQIFRAARNTSSRMCHNRADACLSKHIFKSHLVLGCCGYRHNGLREIGNCACPSNPTPGHTSSSSVLVFLSQKRDNHSKWFCLGLRIPPPPPNMFLFLKINVSFCMRSILPRSAVHRNMQEKSAFSLCPQLQSPLHPDPCYPFLIYILCVKHTTEIDVFVCVYAYILFYHSGPMYPSPGFPMLCIFFLFLFLEVVDSKTLLI